MKAVQNEDTGELTATQRSQQHAHNAISKHLSRHPDAVVISTIKDGHIMIDVTPFANLAGLALLKEMTNKFISEAIERGLMAGAEKPESAPAPTPETPA